MMKVSPVMPMTDNGQLPLQFATTNYQTFDSFEIGENQDLVNSLQTFINSGSESLFYLYGEKGSGKTHLLNALIGFTQSSGLRSVLITAEDLKSRTHVSLIQMFDVLCMDNLKIVAGNPLLEEALFFWINEVRQSHKKIVLCCEYSNHDSHWILPDLKSRLQSGRTHQLRTLNRADTWDVFLKQAKQKGIVMDDKVLNYLQKNSSMNLSYLTRLLQQLDKVTLVEKKQVSIPLIKKILKTVLE